MRIGVNGRARWSAVVALVAGLMAGSARTASPQDPVEGVNLAVAGPRFLALEVNRSSDAAPRWTDASNAAVFRKVISVDLRDVPLAQALSIIAQRAGLRLTNVPAGPHTVKATRIGYRSVSKQVTVVADQDSTVDFALTPRATELEQVVAIGYGTTERRELTGAVSSVTAEQVGSAPVTSVD